MVMMINKEHLFWFSFIHLGKKGKMLFSLLYVILWVNVIHIVAALKH